MDEKIILGTFVAVEGAHAFSAFMPSWFTIRKFALASEDDKDRLRSGYIPAAAFNVILGTSVSLVIKTMWPLLFSVIVSGFMITMYEGALALEENRDN